MGIEATAFAQFHFALLLLCFAFFGRAFREISCKNIKKVREVYISP